MKKLTTESQWYGPFAEIITTDDAYIVDGCILPFDVVGEGVVSDYDPETDIRPFPQELIDRQWGEVRTDRNKRLADCDWTQLPDAPLSNIEMQDWASYRQALRDITNQPDPFNITWPSEPSAQK